MGLYIKPPKASDERATPQDLFDRLNDEFQFTLDVCASQENAKCSRFFTLQDNGLAQPWAPERCWMNPPYSQTGVWIAKAYLEAQAGAIVICLVPSATDTKWWHEWVTQGEIRFIKGRLRFNGAKNSAPFPSALVIFRAQ